MAFQPYSEYQNFKFRRLKLKLLDIKYRDLADQFNTTVQNICIIVAGKSTSSDLAKSVIDHIDSLAVPPSKKKYFKKFAA